ncbi:hypothetical protein PI124_g9596 [Phytophthora idaei]|nr:hypothetical protein PI126_g9261 [Phytophthora idaei]KAG3245676.1 hypothetical protein PI124_g9596 [Phytophthora idaei]
MTMGSVHDESKQNEDDGSTKSLEVATIVSVLRNLARTVDGLRPDATDDHNVVREQQDDGGDHGVRQDRRHNPMSRRELMLSRCRLDTRLVGALIGEPVSLAGVAVTLHQLTGMVSG